MTASDKEMPAVPDAFRALMVNSLNASEGEALIAALDTPPSVAVRLNKAKEGRMDGIPVEWCTNGLRLISRPNFTLDPAWHQGRYYVQEPASMFVSFVGEYIGRQEENKPLRLLDLCAAPGGKTTALADALPHGSMIVANEYVAQRATVLLENLTKWGIADLVVTRGDTKIVCKAAEGQMDVVLADVPCSGEGMMRKEAEARRQWTPSLVKQCAALQREIAANGAMALREGGWMIYSTCTFNASENEENVEWICRELGFEVVELPVAAAWNLRSRGPGYHFYPHLTDTEGLYMCLLRKKAAPRSIRTKTPKLKTVSPKMAPWLKAEDRLLVEQEGTLVTLPEKSAAFIGVFLRNADVLTAGVAVGTTGKRGWEPTHSVAMSTLLNRGVFPEIKLDQTQTLRYLARRTDGLPATDVRGMLLATFAGQPLGWLKGVGNRCNNLYPQNWRIRMAVP